MLTSLKNEPVTMESLHSDCVALEERLYRAKAQRDALLAAAKKVVSWYEDSGTSDPSDATIPWTICRQAIADCEKA